MPRFAANLSMLFTEVQFLERFERAEAASFTAVEYQFPYEWPAEELAQRLQANGLTKVLFNLPPGDRLARERGLASMPNRFDQIRAGVEQGIAYAKELVETRFI